MCQATHPQLASRGEATPDPSVSLLPPAEAPAGAVAGAGAAPPFPLSASAAAAARAARGLPTLAAEAAVVVPRVQAQAPHRLE